MSVDNLNLIKDQQLVYGAYRQLKNQKRANFEAELSTFLQFEAALKKEKVLVQEQDLIQNPALESHVKPVLFSQQGTHGTSPRQVKPDVIPEFKPKTPKPK